MFLSNIFKPKNLWAAAKRGDTDSIEQLVALGHDVNAREQTVEGDTPLHLAARFGQMDALRTLARLGARLDGRNASRAAPLHEAVTESQRSEVVELLLDLGANIDVQDKSGMTALDYACLDGRQEMVALLLKRGATPNVGKGWKRSSPIAHAISGKNLDILKALISAKADVNEPHAGTSPLADAALGADISYVQVLLVSGADPNHKNPESGYTVLMSAVAGGSADIVQMLVEAGADLQIINEVTGETALDIAEKRGRIPIAEFLRSAGAMRTRELRSDRLPTREEPGTFWQLGDGSILSVTIAPWPHREGLAEIKAEASPNAYDTTLVRAIDYRVSASETSKAPWNPMRKLGKDEDDNLVFEASVKLEQGAVFVQFRIEQVDDELTELTDWRIDVQ